MSNVVDLFPPGYDLDGWEIKDRLIQAVSQFDPEDEDDIERMKSIVSEHFIIVESLKR